MLKFNRKIKFFCNFLNSKIGFDWQILEKQQIQYDFILLFLRCLELKQTFESPIFFCPNPVSHTLINGINLMVV